MRTVTARFVEELASSSPTEALATLDLLVGAPPAVIDGVVARLRQTDLLRRLYTSLDPSARAVFLNSQVVGYAKLREFFVPEFEQEVRAALKERDPAAVVFLASASAGFRELPSSVASPWLDILELPDLNDQARHEIEVVMAPRAQELEPFAARLREWASAAPGNRAVERRRALALLILLRLAKPEEAGLVDEGLRSDDAEIRSAAVAYLDGSDEPVFAAHREPLLRALIAEKESTNWNAICDLLWRRDRMTIERMYATLTEVSASTWPGAIQASLILRAPPPYDRTFARWRLSRGTNCDAQWRSVAILESRARQQIDVVDDLLQHAATPEGPCARVRGAEAGLPGLANAMAQLLTKLRNRGDFSAIDLVLPFNVSPSSAELERLEYWSKTLAPGGARQAYIADLHVIRAARTAPDAVTRWVIAHATDSGSDVVLQAEALFTLSAIAPLSRHREMYLNALADTNPVISRTALILLAKALATPSRQDSVPIPEFDVVQNLIQQPDLSNDARELLRRLVPHGAAFAAAYASQAPWDKGVGAPCFALASAGTITTPMVTDLLGSAASAPPARFTAMRKCIALLVDAKQPIAKLARYWENMPADPERIHTILQDLLTLWNAPDFAESASERVKGQIILIVSVHASHLPRTLSGQSLLQSWRDALTSRHPKEADELGVEYRRRALIALAYAIPSVVLVHFIVWMVLLGFYPRFPMLQSLVFWNPWVRKILGLGYIDLVLLNVPFARRRLFAPFVTPFLGDIQGSAEKQLDRIEYFRDSCVRTIAARDGKASAAGPLQPIIATLARHRGRVLLLGKSGLGKSSYLRYSLAASAREGRDVIVYLRADECRNGVEAEIQRRMQDFGRDQNLLQAMIYAGRMYIYIDGYNEVDIKTQELITGFVANYPRGNILVASQIAMRGLSTLATYELQPLDREHTQQFLQSRAAVLSESAPVRGESFVASADAFLEDVWNRQTGEAEARAFDEILSNPMDLTSVALLIGDARVPNVFALEAQQFECVRDSMASAGAPFRLDAFSDALLAQRSGDQENLQGLPFTPEVAALVSAKLALVRTFTDAAGTVANQEVRFRHDRIRDFFTHFAFVRMDPTARTDRAQDARFAGVYPFLARALPARDAEDLREGLIRLAADIEDHRVSDSFVREYSWRQRFASRDPDWMLAYDLPAARAAEAEFTSFDQQRKHLDADMNVARKRMSEARHLTRILTTADPLPLIELARQLCVGLGAHDDGEAHPTGRALRTPLGVPFLLVALGQPESIRSFHLELLLTRLAGVRQRPILMITNAHILSDPEGRGPDLDDQCIARVTSSGGITLSAPDLYRAYLDGTEAPAVARLWSRIEAAVGPGESSS